MITAAVDKNRAVAMEHHKKEMEEREEADRRRKERRMKEQQAQNENAVPAPAPAQIVEVTDEEAERIEKGKLKDNVNVAEANGDKKHENVCFSCIFF